MNTWVQLPVLLHEAVDALVTDAQGHYVDATFGRGGESFLRFNLATPRARVQEAAERLVAAFADLQ